MRLIRALARHTIGSERGAVAIDHRRTVLRTPLLVLAFAIGAALVQLALLAKSARAEGFEKFTEYSIPNPASDPIEITAGPDGNLWFAEWSGKIGRITPSGQITEFSPPETGNLAGIAAGPGGNLWFTARYDNKIGRITPDGQVTEFRIPSEDAEPIDITAGPDGNLWFAESGANKIGRITPNGEFAEFSIAPASEPTGITSGPDGNLWFTEKRGNSIGRITTSGQVTEFQVPTAHSRPDAITSGPDGSLWFTESQEANGVHAKIGRITPNGTITEFSLPYGDGQQEPIGITTGPDGNLWFTEGRADKIGRITPSGKVSEFPLPTSPTTSFPPVSINSDPTGIAPGPDGYLWFTEMGDNKIGRISTEPPLPSNTSPPSIVGKPQPGRDLTVSPGSWTNSPTSYSYQWEDCNRLGASCSSAQRGPRIRLVGAAEVGHTIRVQVIASNAGGESEPAASAATRMVTGPVVRVKRGGEGVGLSLMGSHGYRITVRTYGYQHHRWVVLEAKRKGYFADYAVVGHVGDGTVKARFPRLGIIKVKLRPTKVRKLKAESGCPLPSEVIESGSFVGVIKFNGEKNFTRIDTDRAHGTVTKQLAQTCDVSTPSRPSSLVGTTSRLGRPGRIESSVELTATVDSVEFRASRNVRQQSATFTISAREKRAGMEIHRGAPSVSGTGDFSYGEHLTSAGVTPPRPFIGTASYSGAARPEGPIPELGTEGLLSGTLRAVLPGLGLVHLTGVGVHAYLSISTGVID